ncbi:type VI secretion system lipoprotein TssJ [Desulfovibrio piger]|nr:type VI secretion system lipoprotein TssJ [Desulfovibrio piger]
MKICALLSTLLLTLIPLLHGCSSSRVSMEVASLPNVNPDSSGRPSPVIVKMYELRGDMAFRQGDFQTLFMEPMKVLGPELVAVDELLFVPGEARTVEYVPMPETRYVGILAGFRQMERARWRNIVPVNPEKKSLIRLELNDTSLTVIDPETEWSSEERVRTYQERIGRPAEGKTPEKTSSPASADKERTAPAPQPDAAAPGQALPQAKQLN